MAYYARIDPAQPEPRNVVGWYDTDFAPLETYKEPPPKTCLVEITADQWKQHFGGNIWKIQDGALVNGDPVPPPPPPA